MIRAAGRATHGWGTSRRSQQGQQQKMVAWEAGKRGATGIYACESERPLYVVDAIIYDTYRSQLRVMALALVFMAILFLVAFHGRRRFRPSLLFSPHRCLFLGDFGPYAKQAVILVWFTSPVTPPPLLTKFCGGRDFQPRRGSDYAGSSDRSFIVFSHGASSTIDVTRAANLSTIRMFYIFHQCAIRFFSEGISISKTFWCSFWGRSDRYQTSLLS